MPPLNHKPPVPTHSFGDLNELKSVFIEGPAGNSQKRGYLEMPRKTSDADLLTLPLPKWDDAEMGMTKEFFNAWLDYVKAFPGRNRHERRAHQSDFARRHLR